VDFVDSTLESQWRDAVKTASARNVSGDSIGFGVGKFGLFATNGAEAPVHLCEMKCENADAARSLTEDARSAGMAFGGTELFHSGI
jgi:hypothetical protein